MIWPARLLIFYPLLSFSNYVFLSYLLLFFWLLSIIFFAKNRAKVSPKGPGCGAQAATEQELAPMDPLRSAYRFILEVREEWGGP